MFKIDLHTHSTLSYDGGLSVNDYKSLLERQIVDYVAITDHDEVDFALALHDELGDKVIVGEEIRTKVGEVIGLYLTKRIEPGLSLEETVSQIKEQNGIVCIPHPFEKVRKGVSKEDLTSIASDVEVIEVYNARALSVDSGRNAEAFAIEHRIVGTANSDAHCKSGVGTAYSIIESAPIRETLVSLLHNATYSKEQPPVWTRLCPKINRLKKIWM